MEKSARGTWDAHIWVECPYCGEQQDLIENDGDWRLPENIQLGEHKTEQTTDFITWCLDCGEYFKVSELEW